MSAAVDTLQVTKDLKAASFSEAQAEALARLLRERQTADYAELVTKKDLEQLRADIGGRVADLEQRLTIRLGGMILLGVGAVATLVKLL